MHKLPAGLAALFPQHNRDQSPPGRGRILQNGERVNFDLALMDSAQRDGGDYADQSLAALQSLRNAMDAPRTVPAPPVARQGSALPFADSAMVAQALRLAADI